MPLASGFRVFYWCITPPFAVTGVFPLHAHPANPSALFRTFHACRNSLPGHLGCTIQEFIVPTGTSCSHRVCLYPVQAFLSPATLPLVWWSHAGGVLRRLSLGCYQTPPATQSAPQRPIHPAAVLPPKVAKRILDLDFVEMSEISLDAPPPPFQLVHPYRTFQYGWRSSR